MREQINTIREALEYAFGHADNLAVHESINKALTALAQIEAAVGEPVAMLHDDGYWTPMKTEAGRALNDRLMRAGSLPIDVYAAPVAQQPQYPLPDDLYPDSKDWAAGTYAERVEWLHTMYESQKALVAEYERQLAQQPQAEAITEAVIDAYLEDYEMIGEAEDGRDACYAPSEAEKALIKDAIMGLLAEAPTKQPQAEAVPSIDALEQEIYEHTREFVPRSVMDWMLQRYYPAAPQQGEAVPSDVEAVSLALTRAFALGQSYHETDADSACAKFIALRNEVRAAIAQQKGGV